MVVMHSVLNHSHLNVHITPDALKTPKLSSNTHITPDQYPQHTSICPQHTAILITSLQMPSAHNHSYPHHNRHTQHTTTATPPDTTSTQPQLPKSLQLVGRVLHISWRGHAEVYLKPTNDHRTRCKKNTKFTHHRPCSLHFTIASFENTSRQSAIAAISAQKD